MPVGRPSRLSVVAIAGSELARLWGKLIFNLFQRFGVHVTPVHYYEPIPDTRKLKDELWQKDSEFPGIDINEKGQLDLLAEFEAKYKTEYDALPEETQIPHQYHLKNSAFIAVDAEILYCMIRHFKPRRIFEVGSGNSTYLSAQAALVNKSEGHECELVAFEPYPNETLRKGFPGLSKLVQTKAEDIGPGTFQELGENDILFIDSSHVVRVGNDVRHLYLEVLPRLRKGVIVHVHDIFLPKEYPKEWVLEEHYFWNEQYLLQAFMSFNDSFEVLFGASYISNRHPDRLASALRSYTKGVTRPCSFWIRKKR